MDDSMAQFRYTDEVVDQINRIRALFAECNHTNDGRLDVDQFSQLWKKVDDSWTREELSELFCRVDKDGSGSIDIEEFLCYVFSFDEAMEMSMRHKDGLHKSSVFCRIRPMASGGGHGEGKAVEMKLDGWTENSIRVISARKNLNFTFPKFVVAPDKSQQETFDLMMPQFLDAWLAKLYNVQILAYGQTGTGKTHTMFGTRDSLSSDAPHPDWGLFPRIVHHCFKTIYAASKIYSGTTWALTASAVEFYMTEAFDLLHDRVRVSMDSEGSPVGLATRRLRAVSDLVPFLDIINATRKMSKTQMNEDSSRSHCALILTFHQTDLKAGRAGQIVSTTFTMVDLAGSERTTKTGAEFVAPTQMADLMKSRNAPTLEHQRGMEGGMINFELTLLATEVQNATEAHSTKRRYVKPRGFATTDTMKFLGRSLDGYCLLGMVVCISQSPQHGWETWYSCTYGERLAKLKAPLKKMKMKNLDEELNVVEARLRKARKEVEDTRLGGPGKHRFLELREAAVRGMADYRKILQELRVPASSSPAFETLVEMAGSEERCEAASEEHETEAQRSSQGRTAGSAVIDDSLLGLLTEKCKDLDSIADRENFCLVSSTPIGGTDIRDPGSSDTLDSFSYCLPQSPSLPPTPGVGLLEAPSDATVRITAQSIGGETVADLEVLPYTTVQELKRQIWLAGGPPVASQCLSCQNLVLDDSGTVQQSGIVNGTCLQLVCLPVQEVIQLVRVVVRCRHRNTYEIENNCEKIIHMNDLGSVVTIHTPVYSGTRKTDFVFDAVFDENCSQKQFFDTVGRDIVEDVMQGYNGTVMAYGEPGAGKSYTLFGPGPDCHIGEDQGLLLRSADHLFVSMFKMRNKQWNVSCSFIEIYDGKIIDLLSNDQSQRLGIRESKERGVFVEDSAISSVNTFEDVQRLFILGNQNSSSNLRTMKTMASFTDKIFTIMVESRNTFGQICRGILNLVECKDQRQRIVAGAKEGTIVGIYIAPLVNVVNRLCERELSKAKGKNTIIPYRDSKLTHLLRDSLGGNAKTVLVANVAPTTPNYSEALSTLTFAARAKKINNKPRINMRPVHCEDPVDGLHSSEKLFSSSSSTCSQSSG